MLPITPAKAAEIIATLPPRRGRVFSRLGRNWQDNKIKQLDYQVAYKLHPDRELLKLGRARTAWRALPDELIRFGKAGKGDPPGIIKRFTWLCTCTHVHDYYDDCGERARIAAIKKKAALYPMHPKPARAVLDSIGGVWAVPGSKV